jgi:adenylyltransferase/sulfurtransferase
VPLDDAQLDRYARHIILREVGGAGQQRLLASKVLVAGAGGLGSPLILYLAAAGVGTIGAVDDDEVSLSNLQRQIAHGTADIGRPKTASAAETARSINPGVKIVEHRLRLDATNVMDLVAAYDLVCDGTDNFATRYLLNDACFFARKPLVSGAILQFAGQVGTYKAHLGAPHPCYRCLFPEPPPPDLAPNCADAGVLGALAGVVGSLEAVEALKELLGIGTSLSGRLLLYDALDTTVRAVEVPRDPDCPLCGPQAVIKSVAQG